MLRERRAETPAQRPIPSGAVGEAHEHERAARRGRRQVRDAHALERRLAGGDGADPGRPADARGAEGEAGGARRPRRADELVLGTAEGEARQLVAQQAGVCVPVGQRAEGRERWERRRCGRGVDDVATPSARAGGKRRARGRARAAPEEVDGIERMEEGRRRGVRDEEAACSSKSRPLRHARYKRAEATRDEGKARGCVA